MYADLNTSLYFAQVTHVLHFTLILSHSLWILRLLSLAS
jgi:hypothetical protein